MYVILLGPPGSGTGSQGAIISQRLGIPLLATGDLLRNAVEKRTPLGREAQKHMIRKEMVPDKIILSLIGEQLKSPEAANGVVMDSFPRTTVQAQAVNQMLAERLERIERVLLLDVPEAELIERLTTRASEEERSKDTPQVIQQRLQAYRHSTALLVGFYREMGVLSIVDGTGTEEEVGARVKEVIGA